MKLTRFLIVLAATLVLLSWPVYADTVTIGLQEGGASPTQEAAGTGSVSFDGAFGTFSNVHVTGAGQSTLSLNDLLFSNNISTSTSTAGTLHVFVTDQGLVAPLGTLPFESSFTVNSLPTGWMITEATFISSANALFGGAPLSSEPFSAIGTNVQFANAATGAGPYSVTHEFTVVAAGAGDSNNTIDLSATPVSTPEPGILFVVGAGLLGLGWMRRR